MRVDMHIETYRHKHTHLEETFPLSLEYLWHGQYVFSPLLLISNPDKNLELFPEKKNPNIL